jgi:hypothetical protein
MRHKAVSLELITDFPTDIIPVVVLPIDITTGTAAIRGIGEFPGNELREIVAGNEFGFEPLPLTDRSTEIGVYGKF